MATFRKLRITWQELSEVLSKVGVLMADEEIDNITLTEPRRLLLHTSRERKVKQQEVASEQASDD